MRWSSPSSTRTCEGTARPSRRYRSWSMPTTARPSRSSRNPDPSPAGLSPQPPADQAPAMSIRGAAVVVGAYEHPRREIPDRTLAQLHREVAVGALADAGLTLADVDAYFCDSMAPGFG